MAEKGWAGFLADTLARRMVEDSIEPVVVTDGADGRILYANAAFCRLVGGDPVAVEGALLMQLLPGVDPAMLDALCGQALALGEGADTAWWDLHSTRLADAAGTMIVTRAHEVTDHVCGRLAAEAARATLLAQIPADIAWRDITDLHQARERLQLALQAGGLGIWETDYEAGRTSWDRRMAEMFGSDLDELSADIGQMMDFIHPDDRDRVGTRFEEAIRTLEPFAAEFRIVTVGGQTRWLSTQGIFASGRAIGVARDVTPRKIREERLEQALRERDVLMREADHRIKNSLQLIANLLTLQQRRLADPEARGALADAVARVQAVGETHRSLYQSQDFKTVDFGQTLADICAHIGGLTPAVQLECHAEAGLQLDAERAIPLGLVISELLTNAAKHAYPGSGGRVAAHASATADELMIRVSDTGIGLPESRAGDRGLGGFIVRKLAEQIGALVEIESLPGQGTRATVRLPRHAQG